MALPVVNTQQPVDASTIQQTVLNAAAKTGKLQINNSGSINFTNYVQGGTQTATKESSNFINEAGNKVLGEIRNLLVSLNNNIGKFIQTANIEKSVAANLAEAAKPRDIDETSRYRLVDLRDDFKGMFGGLATAIVNKKESTGINLGGLGSAAGGGIFGGLFNILKGAFGIAFKSIPFIAGAYILNKLSGGRLGENAQQLLQKAENELSGLFTGNQGAGTDGQIHSEPGEIGDTGGQTTTTPSSTQQPNVTPTPVTQQPSSQKQTNGVGANVPFNQQTATRTNKNFGNNKDIATESDLSGLTFTYRKNNPDKNIVKGLAQRLQYIRRKLNGKGLYINSGYRTFAHNKEVGGAKESRHMKGWAVDVSMSNFSVSEKKKFLISASECGIGGIGFYNTFIHLDLGRKRRWTNIPDWAKEIMANHYAGKYSMGVEQQFEDNKSDQHKEPNEAGNRQGQLPQSDKLKKESVSPETGSSSAPEMEDEQEETNEPVLSEPKQPKVTTEKVKTQPSAGKTQPQTTSTQIKSKSVNGKIDITKITFNQLSKEQQDAVLTAQEKREKYVNKYQSNNPGAMVYSSWQKRFGGEPGHVQTGYGQKRVFARFKTYEQGREAQRELWKRYGNRTIADTLKVWVDPEHGGAESKKAYQNYVSSVDKAINEYSIPAIAKKDSQPETIRKNKKTPLETTEPENDKNQPTQTADSTEETGSENTAEQIKDMLPGVEKLAFFGDEKQLLPLLLSGDSNKISEVVSDTISSVKTMGENIRASLKGKKQDIGDGIKTVLEKANPKALLEQTDTQTSEKAETASVEPTPEAFKGEQLNEEAKALESAKTKMMYENNKADLAPVMTPNPPSVSQKKSDNPSVNSTMGVQKMALRNDDEPTLFRLLVKALDIGNVA